MLLHCFQSFIPMGEKKTKHPEATSRGRTLENFFSSAVVSALAIPTEKEDVSAVP